MQFLCNDLRIISLNSISFTRQLTECTKNVENELNGRTISLFSVWQQRQEPFLVYDQRKINVD